MDDVVIVGGGVAGLTAAYALSEVGYQVRLLERAEDPPPDSFAEAADWHRATVPQTRHSHAFLALGRNLLARRAPDVLAALLQAGAYEIPLGDNMPPTLDDRTSQPGDEELVMLACRRPVFEWVLRRAVVQRPRVTVELGARVTEVLSTERGLPRVTGVRTADGRVHSADIVLNATGRRSVGDRWVADAGRTSAKSQSQHCNIVYYTRFYRRLTPVPPGPLNRGFGAGGVFDSYTGMLFLSDSDTFSISLGVLPDDPHLTSARHEAVFTAVARATPLLEPWVAPGVSEAISDVAVMGGLRNRLRIPRPERGESLYGLYEVGDAVCTTNPAFGRGISLALAHAFALADVLAGDPTVSPVQATAAATTAERLFTPWFTQSEQADRARAGRWRAALNHEAPPPLDRDAVTPMTLAATAGVDAVVWRALVRMNMLLREPHAVFGDGEVTERVRRALAAGDLPREPAASRDQLVAAVTAASGNASADHSHTPAPIRARHAPEKTRTHQGATS